VKRLRCVGGGWYCVLCVDWFPWWQRTNGTCCPLDGDDARRWHGLLYDIVACRGWRSISRYRLIDIIPSHVTIWYPICHFLLVFFETKPLTVSKIVNVECNAMIDMTLIRPLNKMIIRQQMHIKKKQNGTKSTHTVNAVLHVIVRSTSLQRRLKQHTFQTQ